MNGAIDTLKKYKELESILEDSRYFYCFNTPNGKRMIVKAEGSKKCIAMDKNFRVVSFRNEKQRTFYNSPLSLIRSYDADSIPITDIFISMDKEECIEYLLGIKKLPAGDPGAEDK